MCKLFLFFGTCFCLLASNDRTNSKKTPNFESGAVVAKAAAERRRLRVLCSLYFALRL